MVKFGLMVDQEGRKWLYYGEKEALILSFNVQLMELSTTQI